VPVRFRMALSRNAVCIPASFDGRRRNCLFSKIDSTFEVFEFFDEEISEASAGHEKMSQRYDATQVPSVVEKFRAKYGTNDVKKYYSKFDVDALAQLP